MALQKPRQPIPLKIGERDPRPRISDDQHSSLQLVRQREEETEECRERGQHPVVHASQIV